MAQDAITHLRQAVSMMTGLGVASRDTIVIAYALESAILPLTLIRSHGYGYVQLTFVNQELKIVDHNYSDKVAACPY